MDKHQKRMDNTIIHLSFLYIWPIFKTLDFINE